MANKFICSFLLQIAITSAYALSVNSYDFENAEPVSTEWRSYVVSVQRSGGEIICGGALIDERTVVSVASCLAFLEVDELVVNLHNGERIVSVTKREFHPNYNPITMANDVSVLKLAERVKAEYVTLAAEQPTPGSSGVVTIWNSKQEFADISKHFFSAEDCVGKGYGYSKKEVFESMICGLGDSCGGLEGYPFTVSDELVGLVSWGYSCGNKEKPAVFSDIAMLKDWIESTSQRL